MVRRGACPHRLGGRDHQACVGIVQIEILGPYGSVVEHSLGKGEVARSIRAMGTKGSEGERLARAGLVGNP